MITPSQFSLFYKIHRAPFIQNFSANLQLQSVLTDKERSRLNTFADQLVTFITKQNDLHDMQALTNQLQLFLQMHLQEITGPLLNIFRSGFEQATLRILFTEKHPKTEQFFTFLSTCMVGLMNQYYTSIEEAKSDFAFIKQDLLKMNNIIIRSSGPEDLPFILDKLKEIFQFKRCIFYMYIPWRNEFKGMIGEKLDIIQNIRGKLGSDMPVFDRRKAVYLRDPAPYIDQTLIDRFNLSSLLFIPIVADEQLYGWLELDQIGAYFPYSASQIETLTTVGKWIGLLLNRKTVTQEQLFPVIHLSDKEQTILHLISDGHSNKEIATLLFLSPYTIRDYVQRLLEKFSAKNRTHLITVAFQKGALS